MTTMTMDDDAMRNLLCLSAQPENELNHDDADDNDDDDDDAMRNLLYLCAPPGGCYLSLQPILLKPGFQTIS